MISPPAPDAPARHPQRVLVAGASGAGKTTMALAIAERWGLSHTEIDAVHWQDGWTANPRFVQQITDLAATERWVTEFQYASARPILADRAQLLVYLDYPRSLIMRRVIRRTLRRRRTAERLWNTDNTEPPLRTIFTDPEHIIRWSWTGIARYRALIADVRRSHPSVGIVTLRSPAEAHAWLGTLHSWQDSDGI